MNRWLVIPAGCCLVAFIALWTGLGGAASKGFSARDSVKAAAVTRESLALEEVKQSLTALTGEYLRPWRQRETSPRHLFSRAAPRPIPSISAEVLFAGTDVQSEGLAVAAIVITGPYPETVPCVVDRSTGRVRLFAGGQWLTEAEWLGQAQMPN